MDYLKILESDESTISVFFGSTPNEMLRRARNNKHIHELAFYVSSKPFELGKIAYSFRLIVESDDDEDINAVGKIINYLALFSMIGNEFVILTLREFMRGLPANSMFLTLVDKCIKLSQSKISTKTKSYPPEEIDYKPIDEVRIFFNVSFTEDFYLQVDPMFVTSKPILETNIMPAENYNSIVTI